MEEYYSNDSFTAFKSENGIVIEEKKKGSIKMLVAIIGIGILVLIGGFITGLFGGNIGLAIAPFLIWGSALVLVIALIAFILKLFVSPSNTKITFDTTTNELTLRGKVIPFGDITQLSYQEQAMMGRTMIVAFLIVKGKKKSLFNTGIMTTDPIGMNNFIQELNALIQKEKSA